MADLKPRTPLAPDGRLGPVSRHPGLSDPAYLRRRNALAALARKHQVGDPAPAVSYTDEEHETWRTVHQALVAAHRGRVCEAVLQAREAAPIPADHVPQHAEVGARLRPLTGFDFTVAGGFVANKRFLGSMDRGYFHAVQFVRHPALPLYTPEPDIIHDVFGHGTHLASPWFAQLYRLFGAAAMRVDSADALDLISRIYWFSLEYGVVAERQRVRAYGAALLSSYGELARLHLAEIRPWDLGEMLRLPFEVAGYQPVLYGTRSLDHLAELLHELLDDFDEETGARLGLPPQPQRGFMARLSVRSRRSWARQT
ncbi:phenylalanine 4-monooxygenase [Kitasatospora kifunensis]|uniref:Phenylalanine-4-hydroxylase n=1 Tax=Kitasatospora kifunensis TaxID=58351 RepID=A0A7W7QYK9_KITKI|nr:phenylalanine 4-monooxygenase [Kitasatospora kifunensis]MBB4921521.1 phenylalanine-4-hydroxylase [Kitasatospora kifunensis]